MIEIKNIVKSFGSNHVLKDISCVFEKGKTNLLIGASGSGKTREDLKLVIDASISFFKSKLN